MRRLIVVRMVSDGSQELVFARARRAVGEIRTQARDAGTDGLTIADIEREIREVRRARRRPVSDAPADSVARP